MSPRALLVIAAFFATTAVPVTALGAPPPNDSPTGFEIVPGAGPFPHLTSTVDVTEATTNPDEEPGTSCSAARSQTVWYRFAPAEAGRYRFRLSDTATSGITTSVIALYTSAGGPFGPFTEIPTGEFTDGCDRGGTTADKADVETDLNAGTQYFVQVGRGAAGTPQTGQVQLRVERIPPPPPPPNDLPADAITLPLNTVVEGTTVGAKSDTTCFTDTLPDVVYRFVPSTAHKYAIRVTGDVHATTMLARNGRDPDTCPTSVAPGAPGRPRYIFVRGDRADFRIEVVPVGDRGEPNDTPAQASPLEHGSPGILPSRFDADFYSLGTYPPGWRVFATVERLDGEQLNLRVTTATDTLEFDNKSQPTVAGTALTGEPAFLRVGRDSHASGVGPLTGYYRLYAMVRPPAGEATPESEPNGTTGTATGSPIDYLAGALPPGAAPDTDFFRFSIAPQQLIFAAIDGDPTRDGTPIDPNLYLHRPSGGAPVVTVDQPDTATDNTSGAGSLTATTPRSPAESLLYRAPDAPGALDWFVRVVRGTNSSKPAGDYLLSVKRCTSSVAVAGTGSSPIATRVDERATRALAITGGTPPYSAVLDGDPSVMLPTSERTVEVAGSEVLITVDGKLAGVETLGVAVTDAQGCVGRNTVGLRVQGIADFDGDLDSDVGIGAPGKQLGAAAGAGTLSALRGSPDRLTAAGNKQWHQDKSGVADTAEADDHFGASSVSADFNRDGFFDLAIGVPDEDVGLVADAGAVHVLRGSATGLTTGSSLLLTRASLGLGTPEPGDRFGAALAAGLFTGNAYPDLAIGIPGAAVDGQDGAGAVATVFSNSNGLSSVARLIHRLTPDVEGDPLAGDSFGAALAADDFGGAVQDDLAIGVPNDDLGLALDAGAVNVLQGAPTGLTGVGGRLLTQDTTGVHEDESESESGDHFGAAVASGRLTRATQDGLVVGSPDEEVNGDAAAGAMHILFGSGGGLRVSGVQFFHQDSGGHVDTTEPGDRYGAALAVGRLMGTNEEDVAVGVPGESVGSVAGAGAVHVFAGTEGNVTRTGALMWHQDTAGIADAAEPDDAFGSALAIADYSLGGVSDLLVGVPFEDVGTVVDAGAVEAIYGDSVSPVAAGNRLWTLAGPDLLGDPQTDDRFGASLTG